MTDRPTVDATLDTVPSLEEASPAYAAAWASLQTLRQARTDNQAKIDRLQSTVTPGAEVGDHAARVARLLGESAGTFVDARQMSAELTDALLERRALNAAIVARERTVLEARGTASALACERIEPRLRELGAELVAAMAAAWRAQSAYVEYTRRLTDAGIYWSVLGPSLNPTMLGDPTEPHSRLGWWFAEAVDGGHVPLEAIPTLHRQHTRVVGRKPSARPASKARRADLTGDGW
jgi:hypothetical protein